MRYVGGKTKIAKWVDENVSTLINGHTSYIEPFVGSGATFVKLAPRFQSATAADDHPDLILMWQAIADGWNPPEHVTKDEYTSLRSAAPSALRGFVGFGASFGGKWFGGYVKDADAVNRARWNNGPFVAAARASVLKARSAFQHARIIRLDYRKHEPDRSTLVYCDPPYAGTLGYLGRTSVGFDSAEFWRTAKRWSDAGATVVVSESQAPVGWRVLASRERKAALRIAVHEENETRSETLWIVGK